MLYKKTIKLKIEINITQLLRGKDDIAVSESRTFTSITLTYIITVLLPVQCDSRTTSPRARDQCFSYFLFCCGCA